VSYCAVCDVAFFKGEVLAVIGGGDAAVEEADYLTRYASKVYIVHRRDQFRASKILQERAFANPKIEVIWNKKVLEIKGNAKGTDHLALEDTVTGERSTLKVGGVFVFIGFRPNTDLVHGHVEHDAGGYFVTDDRMMTSLPGLFAAGDVRSQLTRQIATLDVTPVAIWLTHAHLDHVMGVARLKRETGAPVYLHPADRELYDHAVQQGLAFGIPVDPPPPPDRPFAHGAAVRVGECV